MDIFLQNLLTETGYYLPGFQRGFIAGVIVLFAILLILICLFIFFTPKRQRSKGIDTAGENGALFISSTAVSDLISTIECEFEGIKFSKSVLYKRKSTYYIKLLIELETKDVNFPDLIPAIRDRIFNSLSKNLGVSCVSKVDIFLRKIKSK